MYKVAVLGDRDSIYGFAALGLDVFYADNQQKGREIFCFPTEMVPFQ